ncbi:MAG TPA: hypothetical protein VN317_08870 [Candidatus Methanoperedens sp.]|nr:hypothetical protein [Candidatus Methanoperedens sp.]
MPVHLVGVSIPRAGHHYLVRLLKALLGRELGYCEFYTPLDCCRQVPCRQPTAARVIFQKNHDLDLRLDKHLTDCLYVVQIRSPLPEALSDRELTERVFPELAGDREELLIWLGRKIAYYRLFHQKWIAVPPPNAIVVPYEDLLSRPAAVLRGILARSGVAAPPEQIAAAVARQSDRRDGTDRRFTPRRLPHGSALEPLFLAYEAALRDLPLPAAKLPARERCAVIAPPAPEALAALELAATAHNEVLLGERERAAVAWERFCELFPKNPQAHIERSHALAALGREREALRSALAAARLAPARTAALKRTRDLLHQRRRWRTASRLSRVLAQRHPGRPTFLIDLAVDLHHAGSRAEAAAAARRFVEAARAAPCGDDGSGVVSVLRSGAWGFNEPSFWQAAGHVLLAGGEALLALDVARLLAAVCDDRAGNERLIAQAQRAARSGEQRA